MTSSLASAARAIARMRRIAAGCFVCTLFTLSSGYAGAAEYDAPAVKAAFLHRFAAYVQWPNANSDPSAPFTIAVLDDSEVVEHLQRLLPGLTLQNRRAQVLSIEKIGDGQRANILYIGSARSARAKTMIATIKGQPVLVVTSHESGLADGATINFMQVGRNVRFEVSLPAARSNGLQINSGLLSVAVRVEDEPRAGSGSDMWPIFTRSEQHLARLASARPGTFSP